MARYTRAYSAFTIRLEEIQLLYRLAATKEAEDPLANREEINALCRGSIVLLSSHLEAFIGGLGEIALDSLYGKAVSRDTLCAQFYYHISKDILREIKDTSDHRKISEKVFDFIQSDLPYWSRSGVFSQAIPTERFNIGFSNPSFKKIKKYFNRFGYEAYEGDFNTLLKASSVPTINMVNHLVDVRNKIAHGDQAATKTPREIETMTKTIRLFSKNTDSIFATWWKTSFCAIR
jgi:hypothetical protein